MSLSIQQNKLAEIIDFTDKMLGYANAGDWESVDALQRIRDGVITDLFSDSVIVEADFLAEQIRHILKVDKEIMALGWLYRNDLQEQLRKIQQGKSAVKAYSAL
ncbi:MAG: flagellar protein FliT [Methylobacter sp.]|uniref:flagellar protein FliT n=1 Tax=Methylobacter sp. TaxID=2051955 RepID=UPI00258559CE|nr:flagellar protein FliT [Methylobacter sp.]MCL7419403.1 flagellar protein FliT [Methylobacter sp.]